MSAVQIDHFLDAVPAARSKLLIDMVNCLDVVDGHIRVAQARENSFFARLIDGVRGHDQRRNNAIAEHQQTALRNVINETEDLARGIAHSHRALAITGERLKIFEVSLAHMAHVIADQRDALRSLRSVMQEELARVDADLARLDMHTAAQDQIEWVFSRWDAGGWSTLPLAGRCYVAMHELYWGNFGEYYRRHPGERSKVLLETAENKVVARLHRDAHIEAQDSLALPDWLKPIPKTSHLFAEGLSWLGEKHQLAEPHPMAYLCTQWQMLETKPQPPVTVPRLLPAKRLAGMVTDVFFGEAEAQYAQ